MLLAELFFACVFIHLMLSAGQLGLPGLFFVIFMFVLWGVHENYKIIGILYLGRSYFPWSFRSGQCTGRQVCIITISTWHPFMARNADLLWVDPLSIRLALASTRAEILLPVHSFGKKTDVLTKSAMSVAAGNSYFLSYVANSQRFDANYVLQRFDAKNVLVAEIALTKRSRLIFEIEFLKREQFFPRTERK